MTGGEDRDQRWRSVGRTRRRVNVPGSACSGRGQVNRMNAEHRREGESGGELHRVSPPDSLPSDARGEAAQAVLCEKASSARLGITTRRARPLGARPSTLPTPDSSARQQSTSGLYRHRCRVPRRGAPGSPATGSSRVGDQSPGRRRTETASRLQPSGASTSSRKELKNSSRCARTQRNSSAIRGRAAIMRSANSSETNARST